MRLIMQQQTMTMKSALVSVGNRFNVCNSSGQLLYTVQDRLSIVSCMDVRNAEGQKIGAVYGLFSFFCFFLYGRYSGFFRQSFHPFLYAFRLQCRGWRLNVEGDSDEWTGIVRDDRGNEIAQLSKSRWDCPETYVLDIVDPENELLMLLILLAICATMQSAQADMTLPD